MTVLIAFEESQTIANAFRKQNILAYSNDIKPTSGNHPEYHLQMDAEQAITMHTWDLIIAHPPCTYTAWSGNTWYANTKTREEAKKYTKHIWELITKHASCAALEQPRGEVYRQLGKPTQIIQPWQFGETDQKETWLWLKNLPKLKPTSITPLHLRTNKIHLMPDSKRRQELRSKTYKGIAEAIATQWQQPTQTPIQISLW